MTAFSLRSATAADLDDIRALFREYAASLPIDLCFQGFDEELAGLPGKYAAPQGALLIAHGPGGETLGCVALRPLEGATCEMKRLYTRPAARGTGLGKALVAAIMAEGRKAGYTAMRLDTLPSMVPAIRLYEAAGFRAVPSYYDTPIGETLFFEAAL